MPLEGPCDAPGCTRTDNSCRFRRPATKPELAGKQVCPNRRCQFWGGNRDEASEKATKEAKAAAAAAAKQGSTAAGVVSPRRQGRAEPLPAGTQPTAQAVPAVPVGGGAGWWFNPTTVWAAASTGAAGGALRSEAIYCGCSAGAHPGLSVPPRMPSAGLAAALQQLSRQSSRPTRSSTRRYYGAPIEPRTPVPLILDPE